MGETSGPGEKPLPATADVELLAVVGCDPGGPFRRLHLPAFETDLAVALQVPHVAALMALDRGETLGTAKVVVKGEISGNLSLHGPFYQFLEPSTASSCRLRLWRRPNSLAGQSRCTRRPVYANDRWRWPQPPRNALGTARRAARLSRAELRTGRRSHPL